MKKDTKKILNLYLRYFILVLIAIPGFDLFYYFFLPLTKYPVFWFLGLFFDVRMVENMILVGKDVIEIIGACVAGSAYYFLLILNLSTPKIKVKKRMSMILFSFVIFYLINLLRIILLSFMFLEGSFWFDFSHKVFWYLGSTLLVLAIWFLEVKIYKIEEIPFYSDLKSLYKSSSSKKRVLKKK
jgi:exosortase/archaeosortase family protein